MRHLTIPADPNQRGSLNRIWSGRTLLGAPYALWVEGSGVLAMFYGLTRGHAIARAEARHAAQRGGDPQRHRYAMRPLNLPADTTKPNGPLRIMSERAPIGIPTATFTEGSVVIRIFLGLTRGHAISRAERWYARHQHLTNAEFRDLGRTKWMVR